MPVRALQDSLSGNLAISFCPRSLFAGPRSPVRSLSRTSFLFFSLLGFQFFSFIQGFSLVSVMATCFCISIVRFSVTKSFFFFLS